MPALVEPLVHSQRSLKDLAVGYELWPPLTKGCPKTGTASARYPLEVSYDHDALETTPFEQAPLPGLGRWMHLLAAGSVDSSREIPVSDVTVMCLRFYGSVWLRAFRPGEY